MFLNYILFNRCYFIFVFLQNNAPSPVSFNRVLCALGEKMPLFLWGYGFQFEY